jgi:hypothetical protein
MRPVNAVHAVALTVIATAEGAAVVPMLIVCETVHPLASFATTVYVPAASPVNTCAEENAPPLNEYVNGAVPPIGVCTLIEPVGAVQPLDVLVLANVLGPGVVEIVTVVVNEHPVTSLTTIVCVPAASPL